MMGCRQIFLAVKGAVNLKRLKTLVYSFAFDHIDTERFADLGMLNFPMLVRF
jgi:hypothetical protein